jgi:hypothetical protein
MTERDVKHALREEYFRLLPDIRRVVEQLETEVRHRLLPISRSLAKHERADVISRIKECESAIESLRKRQPYLTFDPSKHYSLKELPDLAGARVLVFPRSRLTEIDERLRDPFADWTSVPVYLDEKDGELLAFKYNGFFKEASTEVKGEYQIVPMLIGLFWDVEHDAIYKVEPSLAHVSDDPKMKRRVRQVYYALRDFEEEFERLVRLEPFQRDRE